MFCINCGNKVGDNDNFCCRCGTRCVRPKQQEYVIYSQYSDMPRYYTIDGKKYDIDNPCDIKRLPLFRNIIIVHGEKYGMDSILLEHGRQSFEKNINVYHAAIDKVNQYRYGGIEFKSNRELAREAEYRKAQEELQKEKDNRKQQCDAFTIEDMHQFSDIPFGWHWVMQLQHTNGIAWFMLNRNNQEIALSYIAKLNDLIIDAHEYVEGISDLQIDLGRIDFDYPEPMHQYSMANTRVECFPYTKTGKISKYPAILNFRISETEHLPDGYVFQHHPVSGEVKILKDGNIGSATVTFIRNLQRIKFTFGLYGLSLVIKRIGTDTGNIYRFDDEKG